MQAGFKSSFLALGCFFISIQLIGQDRFELSLRVQSRRERIPPKTVNIEEAQSDIKIDGILDEQVWKEADKAANFRQYFPADTGSAFSQTKAMFTYDDQNIYVGIVCYDDLTEKKYVIQSLRRDFSGSANDHVAVIIDPFNGLTNGFVFGVNPLGVQLEGLLSGSDEFSSIWDNVWFSQVRKSDESWVAEMKIPFKTLRYNDQTDAWNVQLIRRDLKRNETSTWTDVKRQFRVSNLTFSGRLKWDSLPPPAGSNISFIPYLSGAGREDQQNNEDFSVEGSAGFDGKVALSSALNLDLTVNPDFSTAAVDQQLTNISRFELFFPERRQFFLENSDLFTEFGFSRSRVFFSRRIGLASPMLFGARLSGQLGPGLRIGLLNAQTENYNTEEGEDDIPAFNFTVATLQKQVFGRSFLSGIFASKQSVNYEKDSEAGLNFGDQIKFNRVFGLQYDLLSKNNKWEGKYFLFKSDDPLNNSDEWAHGAFLRYRVRNRNAFWVHEFIGENYTSEMGFVPRKGFFRILPSVNYLFYPNSQLINQHGPGLRFTTFFDRSWDITDRELQASYGFNFLNGSELEIEFRDIFIKLLDDFDPTQSEDTTVVPLAAGTEHNWNEAEISYESDPRKVIRFDLNVGHGGFYSGDRLNFSGNIRYRIQPILDFAFNFSFNRIDLPDPHPDGSFWLLGPRVDLTFTDKIYWTNFIQFNEQIDNIGLNSRFQWRFAPVSDLFLVYNENYIPDGLQSKNRSIVLKISYWINI